MNVVPEPTRERTLMTPPAAATMRCEMASPRPVPRSRVVKNGTNSFGSTSGGMPGPESSMRSSTHGCGRPLASVRSRVSLMIRTTPAPMACTAFCTRLMTTCRSRSTSMCTSGRLGSSRSSSVTPAASHSGRSSCTVRRSTAFTSARPTSPALGRA
jgi:hypothetical protein